MCCPERVALATRGRLVRPGGEKVSDPEIQWWEKYAAADAYFRELLEATIGLMLNLAEQEEGTERRS